MDKHQSLPLLKSMNRGAIQIALLYLLLGGLWILLSDKIAARIAPSQEMLTIISLYKGWGYVLVTALLLYWLIRRDTAALRASEAQLQQVIDALPAFIAYVDKDRRYRFTNKTYEEWFGDTAQGKTVEEILGKKAYETISRYIDQALQGEAVNHESSVSLPQGERFINATYVPDKTEDGHVRGFFALVQDITESKQTREELRQWADAFNGCAHGIAIGDPGTNRVVVCNPAFANLYKGNVEDIIGLNILSLYAPAEHELVRRNIEKADQIGRARYETHMVRKDGSTFPVQMDLVSVLGDDGELLYRVATVQDIADRKQAEEQSKSLARFPDENPNPVLRVTYEGKIIYANAASRLLLEDWRCQVGDDLPPDWIMLIEELAQVRAGKTIDVQCQDTAYSIIITPIPDANYVNLYGSDITERKKAETALLESSIQFRTLFEASPDAILLIDPRGNWPILDCNTVACQMNGYERDELIGQPIDILNPNPLPRNGLNNYLATIQKANVLRYETMHRRKDGSEFPIEVSTSLISLSGHDVLLGIDRDITERKRAEENLRRFELLSEHSRDIILFMRREDGHILEANAAAVQAYGYSREELLELTVQDLRASNTVNLTAEQMAQADAGGILFETIHQRKDGSTFPVEVSSRGATIGGMRTLISIVRDITERRQAEEALRNSQAQMSGIFNSAMDAIISIDADQRIVIFNPSAEAMFQCDQSEATGQPLDRFIPERFREAHRKYVHNFGQTGSTSRAMKGTTVVFGRRSNGDEFPCEASISQVDIAGKKIYTVILRDITERQQIEMALQEAHAQLELKVQERTAALSEANMLLQALMDNMPDQIYFKDTQSRFIRNSRSQADLLGLNDPAEIVGKTDFDFFPHAARAYAEEQEVMRSGKPLIDLEEWVVWPNGQETWVSTTKAPLRNSEGKTIGIFGISRDITERKQAEQAIRQLNTDLEKQTEQLEVANKELEAFSYSVSHDLRAPLRAIDGYTHILVEDYEQTLDEEGKRICSIISAEAHRMGQLIDDLLAFSRLGRKAMYTSKVDMKALATAVFNELVQGGHQERIDFQITRLPAVKADPSLIRQVWANLLSNAIKFTSGKERAVIKVGTKQSKDEYIYYVSDTGAGFDMEYVDKLFGVFQRLHSEREFEGTGVGLAIVQRIIRRHGGRVWAEGEPEKGATFYFALPRKEDSHE